MFTISYPAARRLDPVIEDGLHEIEAGELEGRRDREAVMQYFGTLNQWGLGNLGAAMPGAGDGFCDACPISGGLTSDDEMFVALGTMVLDRGTEGNGGEPLE